MSSYSFHTEIAIASDYDVIVFGGGVAGSIAAIQAGRLGARVALIEKNAILGGTTIVASVDFPGLFHAWTKQIIAGIGWEAIEETVRRGGAVLPDFSVQYEGRQHPKHQIKINRFVFSAVLDEMCMQAGVDIRFHEMPVHIESAAEWRHVVVAGKTGLTVLRAKKLIDATGDANIVGMMGYEREKGDVLQPGTLIYRLNGYRLEEIDRQKLLAVYSHALAAGEIVHTDHRRGEVPLWSELVSGGGSCMHITGVDGSSSQSRTRAELKGRQSLLRIYTLLRRVPGCEQLQVSYVANECGIRETWRIVGEERITREAYTSGYVWPDAVCYSFYPIDVHSDTDSTVDIRPLLPGVVPTIPYGALVPRSSHHLLAAGRCISGDREANSAYRVQATCMATGQAAGVAAVLAAQRNLSVREVKTEDIKAVLQQHRAIVP